MEITVNEIEPCRLSVNYIAGPEEILNKRAEILQAFKKAPVPGFRKNKASIDAIRVHYKTQIEESLKRGLAEESYHNTLFEKKIKPHGAPKFNSLLLADGKFTCEFELYVKPAFELAAYSGLEVPKPHEVQNVMELTEELLQNLRVRFGETVPYSDTDFVQVGDKVIVDYEGTLDGQKLDQVRATGEVIIIGSSNLTQFDQNLLGMMLSETRSFDLVVPEGALPSLVGKTINITVTLTMGSKIIPCPLDDTLAVKLGKKDFQELRDFAHATADAGVQNKYKSAIFEAVANRLVESNTIDVPNWMNLAEAQYIAYKAKLDWNTLSDDDKEKYLKISEKNVKLSLILDRIREENPEAQLTDQEVFDIIKQNLANTRIGVSIEEIIAQMNKTGDLQVLSARIRDEYAMDFIIKTIKIIE